MSEIIVKIPDLHASQQQVLAEAKRFNVLKNGRRWGKTKFGIYLSMDTMLEGGTVGYWTPTYKDLNEVWLELKFRLYPVIKRKDEQVKQIEIINGGKIDFWSMEDPNSGRGRFYKRAIVDECEKSRNFKECFDMTIRATLMDKEGDAWLLSTPKGRRTYFHELFERKDKYDNWISWQKGTRENPFIPQSEIDEFKNQLDTFTYLQEIEGESIDHSAHAWAYAFNDEKHTKNLELNIAEPVFISFDFNHAPRTCTLWQHYENKIRCLTEFESNYGLMDLCGKIKTYIGEENGELQRQVFITGDMSGWAKSALVEGNRTAYDIIASELYLTKYQIQAPRSNPNHTKSRELVNSLLEKHPDFLIDKMNCPKTIFDLKFAESTDTNDIVKDRNKQEGKADYLDNFCYYLNTYHQKFIRH